VPLIPWQEAEAVTWVDQLAVSQGGARCLQGRRRGKAKMGLHSRLRAPLETDRGKNLGQLACAWPVLATGAGVMQRAVRLKARTSYALGARESA